jgi:hypothetical protein
LEGIGAPGRNRTVGLAAGMLSGRFVDALLFQVKATDAASVANPLLAVVLVVLFALLPPSICAMQIDPVETLRND